MKIYLLFSNYISFQFSFLCHFAQLNKFPPPYILMTHEKCKIYSLIKNNYTVHKTNKKNRFYLLFNAHLFFFFWRQQRALFSLGFLFSFITLLLHFFCFFQISQVHCLCTISATLAHKLKKQLDLLCAINLSALETP